MLSIYHSRWVGLVAQVGTEDVPKVNMLFTFANNSEKVDVLESISAVVSTPRHGKLEMQCEEFFEYQDGRKQVKSIDYHALPVPANGSAVTGIQFKHDDEIDDFEWSAGKYKFEILANGKALSSFDVTITDEKANIISSWMKGSAKKWLALVKEHGIDVDAKSIRVYF